MVKRNAAKNPILWLIVAPVLVLAMSALLFLQWSDRLPNPSEVSPGDVSRTVALQNQQAPVPPAQPAVAAPVKTQTRPIIVATPHDQLLELALDHPNPAVRLSGIESSLRQRSEEAFDLLWEAAQRDAAPDNRLSAVSALEEMLKKGRGDSEEILRLLADMANDPDPRVAELSTLVVAEHFGEALDLAQVEEPVLPENTGEWPPEEDLADAENTDEMTETSFQEIRELVLFNPDPAVRLGGIETIAHLNHDDSLGLLADAALTDHDPDIRLAAVQALEAMLHNRTLDAERVVQFLQDTATDPDPRVAELSALLIEEHLRAMEERSKSHLDEATDAPLTHAEENQNGAEEEDSI